MSSYDLRSAAALVEVAPSVAADWLNVAPKSGRYRKYAKTVPAAASPLMPSATPSEACGSALNIMLHPIPATDQARSTYPPKIPYAGLRAQDCRRSRPMPTASAAGATMPRS